MLHLLHHLLHMQPRRIKKQYGLKRLLYNIKMSILQVHLCLQDCKGVEVNQVLVKQAKHEASSCLNVVHFITTHTDCYTIQQLPLCTQYEVHYMSSCTSQQLVAVNDMFLVAPSTNSFMY